MKKNYKTLSAVLSLTALFSWNMNAQFSGLYTINSGAPASGTNFTSFSTFASSINVAGVSGPVTVNVAAGSGPYVEQVEFTAIAGTSATNSIAINGNSNTITFAATAAARHTIKLSGTDFMTVNSLTVIGTDANNALVVHLWNGANNNRFNNCRVEATLNGTGYEQVAISVSGASNNGIAYGTSGDNNIFDGCVTSGGYTGFTFYGGSIPGVGNQLINSTINDFYYYGILTAFNSSPTIRNNIVQRVNRSTVATAYCILLDGGTYAATCEKNKIRRTYDAATTSGSATYGIYIWSAASQASLNVVSNNLVSDITSNGSIYGVLATGTFLNLVHNTIVLDNTISTGGTIYGINCTGSNCQIKNNLVSINRTGTGTKYCVYITGSNQCNNNILFNNSPAGSNYIGGNGGNFATLAGWQSGSSFDLNSVSGNPSFANPTLYDYTPTSAALNNVGTPTLGITTDINGLTRNAPAPDAGAFEFFNQNCSNVPGTNSVVAPSGIVCPQALNQLSVANGYSVNGITYTWKSAANLVGPYTAISGATLASYMTTTLSASTTTYYTVDIACTFGGSTLTAVAGSIQVAGTTTNTVPYFEGFEGINLLDELPNCSWQKDNAYTNTQPALVSAFRQARTGTKFAEFDCMIPTNQARYFYSNGIYLNTGVTYSGSIWYNTPGYFSWNNLNLMYGPSQSPTGLVSIANIVSPTNMSYAPLTNTFVVTTSGLYYIAVKATEGWSYSQLVWDDLSITIPCELPANLAPVAVTGATATCAGQPINLTASGAASYTWSSGANTSVITVTPSFNTTYTVTGTNSLSGCPGTILKSVLVNQLPPVSIVALKQEVCQGESVALMANSANSYTWSANGSNASVITVTPTQNANTYTLLGSDAFGCVGTAVQQITVNSLPVIAISGNTTICYGNSGAFTATGANTYMWTGNLVYGSPSVILSPTTTTVYDVEGTDVKGCKGTTQLTVLVDPCTGIASISGSSNKVSVYPNPNNGVFTVELNNSLNKTIEVFDVTVRLVVSNTTSNNVTDVNISSLANGVYYVKVKSESTSEVIKIVKH